MEATASGRLVEIVAEPGSELPVGQVIGYLDDDS
jgi:pyruvate/2-oxoglutarate dehydrogenase complex dihydrolipoamide acyltransferase (E2) component